MVSLDIPGNTMTGGKYVHKKGNYNSGYPLPKRNTFGVPKKKKSHKNIAQSISTLKSNGLKAFQNGNYTKAISAWESIPSIGRPAAALAEVYFRRALIHVNGNSLQAGLNDLKRAAAYQPADPCYAYHLGLALHRSGDISGALSAYKVARQNRGPFAVRAAYPLALALLQTGQEPSADPAWSDLAPSEQAVLRAVRAFRRKPYNLPPEAPRLWRALAALDNGDGAQAQADLDQVLTETTIGAEKGSAHFYRGVLAAQTEDWETARREWTAAYAAGLRSPRLEANLAEIYHRITENLLADGDAQTALAAALEAKRHCQDDSTLNELIAQIHQHLGYQAATVSHWDEAQSHWQTAVEMDRANFRLAYNLALVYERSDNPHGAGDAWREALRRRPRRADHPDALTDEQVARLWQRAAQCYQKSGDHEEANRTYQQAIKWSPENLDLRLALVESLLADDRLIAARNELERLLERDPSHVPALLRLGEAYFSNEDEPWWIKSQAKRYWEKAFALQPDNPQVRKVMAEWYVDQAEIDYSWDRYAEAIEDYQKALTYTPDNHKALAYIAECYLELDNEAKGREYTEQVLAQATDFDTFATVVGIWLRTDHPEQAWEVVALAETRLGQVPTDFYVFMASGLLRNHRKEQAQTWLDRAVEKSAPDENVLVMIGEMAMDLDPPLAREYLQKAIIAGQMPGQAHVLLGVVEARQKNDRASKKHLADAERIARQTKDADLAERVEMARIMAGGPLALIESLMKKGGPVAIDEFLENFLNEDFIDE